MNFTGKRVLVIGLGATGFSTARYLSRHGAEVTVLDSRENPLLQLQLKETLPKIHLYTGPFESIYFEQADLVVLSPGVSIRLPIIQAYRRRGGVVTGDVQIFAEAINHQQSKIIAITGSNGKSTVTELVGYICRQCGQDTLVVGNIGLPVLDALTECELSGNYPAIWVIELSSFQLETTCALNADAAAVLNISEDHLDRYDDLLDYAYSKTAIFNGKCTQVLNYDDMLCRMMVRKNRQVRWFSIQDQCKEAQYALKEHQDNLWLSISGQPILPIVSLKLQGLHNAANVLAALALCESVGLPRQSLIQACASFNGLAHRVELVDHIAGVDYIDDSKGTNVGATVAALNGIDRPVILIAGGDGKGQNFEPLAVSLQRAARAVCLIGRDAQKIANVLEGSIFPVKIFPTMEAAVKAASDFALPGDVVLLSPACASLDMFCDYKQRAEVFCRAVAQIKQRS